MKLLVIAVITLLLLIPVTAHTTPAGPTPQASAQAGSPTATSVRDPQAITITRSGSQPSQRGAAEYFAGSVRIDTSFQAGDPGRAGGGRVTFESGARTAWHSHPLGQTLIVIEGTGRVQRWSGPVEEIRKGDVVWIPPGRKHWHGAAPTTSMTHIALAERRNGRAVDWMKKVSDEQYGKQPSTSEVSQGVQNMKTEPSNPQPSAAQRLMGDIAPKLAELTDEVLFGDVWERPGLSKRDRSLVTVATLIAMNRPDQLRSHMRLARENGVTEEEIVETITHLAFYAGWPSAVTATSVAREVFEKK
jgi:4-carboxymuconolactone decarboxylase